MANYKDRTRAMEKQIIKGNTRRNPKSAQESKAIIFN
jgi:hypothetical protein